MPEKKPLTQFDAQLKQACLTNDLERARQAIAHGANLYLLVNEESYQGLLDYVATKQQRALTQLLLEKRTPFPADYFDRLLLTCVNEYMLQAGSAEKNQALLAHYVNRLTQCNVGDLLVAERRRYLVHLESINGSKPKQAGEDEILTGWHLEKFLPLRVFNYFELLVKLHKNWPFEHLPTTNPGQDMCTYLKQQLRTLLLEYLEAFHTYRENLLIQKNFGESASGLRQQLARRLVQHIGKLANAENYQLCSGYRGHALYVNFRIYQQRGESHVLIRIDNLGGGSQAHQQQGSGSLYPYVLGSLPAREFQAGSFADAYIFKLLSACFEAKERALPQIYGKDTVQPKSLRAYPENRLVACPKQDVGNCVVWNTWPRLQDMQPELASWLWEQEKHLVVAESRSTFATQAGQDRHWSIGTARPRPLRAQPRPSHPGLFSDSANRQKAELMQAVKWLNQADLFDNGWSYHPPTASQPAYVSITVEDDQATSRRNRTLLTFLKLKAELPLQYREVGDHHLEVRFSEFEAERLQEKLKQVPQLKTLLERRPS